MVTTGPQDTTQTLSTPLADATAQLQKASVDVYSIGIGPDVVPSELETIASRPEYVFRTEVASLPLVSSQLTDMIRQGKVLFIDVSVLSIILLPPILTYTG